MVDLVMHVFKGCDIVALSCKHFLTWCIINWFSFGCLNALFETERINHKPVNIKERKNDI